MKRTKILYWIITIIFAGFMIFSALPDLVVNNDAIDLISTQLGYPEYIIRFLGVAKILGAIVILLPGFPRLKEWAYAGLVFDLIGAMYSSAAVSDKPAESLFMLPIIAFAFASYFLYHKKSKYEA